VRTERQRRGAFYEDVAAAWLQQHGWRLVARNVKVGRRDEIDIVAIDPGPPAELVCVEVRSARSRHFGSPEERVDTRKVGHLYRSMRALDAADRLPRRVDLIVVDAREALPSIRHIRRLEPA
jgi:putative endonuclease